MIGLIAASRTEAQNGEATALSLDRLAQDVVARNPERQFYEQQITAAETQRQVAGRWADPEAVVEFGERRQVVVAHGRILKPHARHSK